jgi:hypothetical protein
MFRVFVVWTLVRTQCGVVAAEVTTAETGSLESEDFNV